MDYSFLDINTWQDASRPSLQPSLQIHPRNVGAPRPRRLNSISSYCLRRSQQLASTNLSSAYTSLMPVSPSSSSMSRLLNASAPPQQLNLVLPVVIVLAELFITLAVSKFKGQQSTLAQRAWTVTWLIAGSFGSFISDIWRNDMSLRKLRFAVCAFMLAYAAPAIGGIRCCSPNAKSIRNLLQICLKASTLLVTSE